MLCKAFLILELVLRKGLGTSWWCFTSVVLSAIPLLPPSWIQTLVRQLIDNFRLKYSLRLGLIGLTLTFAGSGPEAVPAQKCPEGKRQLCPFLEDRVSLGTW
jgi:hypothetical protein